jgi:endonuclease YncB( thermonuclease family)
MKQLCTILLLSSTTLFSQMTGKVIKVSDGDTVTVLTGDGYTIKCRLAEIDCPEKKQEFGLEAKAFTNQLLNKEVQYETIKKDGYSRYLTKIYYNKRYFSELLVEAGLAWHYKKYSGNKTLSDLETIAKTHKFGIWKSSSPIAPWDYRHKKY